MKQFLFICSIILISCKSIFPQIPDTVWTKTFGGPLSDVGVSVRQTNDNGFIVAGTTSSFGAGGQDIYLINTNANGDTLWTKTFGGTGNDRASNVQQTNDNGYAIFGTTNSFGNGGDDFLLWKTDSLGNSQWYKTYGESTNEVCTEGKQTIDGGFIITGYFYSQTYKSIVIKLDELGNLVWDKILIRSNSNLWARSVEQTIDSWYVIGCTWSFYYFGNYAYEWYVYGLAENGDSLFATEYWNVGYDFFKTVRNTKENGFILGGSTADEFIWLKKMGPNGWNRLISVPQIDIRLSSLEPTSDSGFIMTAIASDISLSRDIILIKIDDAGIVQWERRIGGNGVDNANSVYPTHDDGYIVTGQTNSFGAGDYDIWLLKFKYTPSPVNVQINFFPPVDTALVLGDCTTPEIICKNLSSTAERDSISIEPGFNTYFYYFDSTGVQIPLNNYYFIVVDSLDEYEYELWYYPKSFPPFEPILIRFDSTFYSDQNYFDLQMIVKKDGVRIDSLSQPFHADFGLSVDDLGIIPNQFSLSQNFPNPFNPLTKIKYTIPPVTLRQAQSDSWVSLKVYDVLGNEVATLVNEEKQPGVYEVEFNPESSIKHPASGVYFYQLKSGSFVETKKMLLLK